MKPTGKQLLIGGFILTALLQMAVPIVTAAQYETTLHSGSVYNFRLKLAYPRQTFRGRYIQLILDPNIVSFPADLELNRSRPLYATLARDDEDFALFTVVGYDKPRHGDYIMVTSWWQSFAGIDLRLPFNRYYVKEDIAPAVEKLLAEMPRERWGLGEAYVSIRVLGGRAIMEELFIDGKAVRELAQKE